MSEINWEEDLSKAIDLYADEKDKEAEDAIQEILTTLRKSLETSEETIRIYMGMGQCLQVLEEFEQALLRYEKILHLDPNHEDALWCITRLLLEDLDSPKEAGVILKEKLIKLHPNNEEYIATLKHCENYLKAQLARDSKSKTDKEELEEEILKDKVKDPHGYAK
jgi:tetratricopeptide (TPR) repeat protein